MDEKTLRTPTEEKLGTIWSQILGKPVTDRRLDFFRNGGDSLLATMVTVHVRKLLGTQITPQLLFAWPVLADIAHQIDLLRGDADHRPD